jgi:hypothetical protein
MDIALVAFLGVVPAVLLFLAALRPSPSSLRRLFATVGLQVRADDEAGADAIGSRLRRRRVFAVAGATLGFWATATWSSATSTWNGLIPVLSEPPVRPVVALPGAALSTSALTFFSASFVLTASTYGILVGYMVGIVIAEWTGRHGREASRAALLAPHDARHYLVGWASGAVTLAGAASLVALAVVYAIDDISYTGSPFAGSLSYSPHWWWALALIAVGVVALLTRSVVLSSGARAAIADDLAAREITRALTAATMTVVALAAFAASTASTLTLISMYFLGNGWSGEIGTETAALVALFVGLGLEVAAFLTPYWLIAVEIESPSLVAA